MDFRVLVHSRDAQLFLLLQHVLATEGFTASLIDGMNETSDASRNQDVRAVIVDCSTLGADVRELCSLKAAGRKVSVVLLLNQAPEAVDFSFDDVRADLVLGRPFDPALLVRFLRRLRLDALIESGRAGVEVPVLRFADLEMNMVTVRVRRNGRDVPLTPLQFRLLRHLMQNPAAVQSRDELIASGWPPGADVEPRTVDIHMGHIRRALKRFGPDIIRTVRTMGYALDASANLTALPSPPHATKEVHRAREES